MGRDKEDFHERQGNPVRGLSVEGSGLGIKVWRGQGGHWNHEGECLFLKILCPMKNVCIFLSLLVLLGVLSTGAMAQKQLLLLKREKVVLRLVPGDDFVYRKKGGKVKESSYINIVLDTAVKLHRDTVPLHTIERLYFQQHRVYNLVGYAMLVGGIGYFLIDQFNEIAVRGHPPNLDVRVARSTAVLVTLGLPLMYIRKKSQRIRSPYRLYVADEGSAFYQRME